LEEDEEMTQKRMSERLGKKVSKDDLIAGKDYVEDMFDALGTEDPNWNHKKVKALVKALIESKIIFQAQSSDQVFLERILLSKEVNKTQGKWGKFFKDLPSAALTKEGLKEIINFVDSNKKSPPEIGTGDQDETEDYTETELSDAKTSSIATKDIDTTNLLGPVKLDSVDTILAHSKIQSQILSADKDSMEFFIKYCIHKLWNLAFKFRDKTYEEVKTGVKASKTKNEFLRQYVGRFLKEYEGTMALQLPKQYKFPEKPNLMQLYVAYKTTQLAQFANFSEPGSGKTLSAVLASRIINSKMTLVLCPNSVVEQWGNNIKEIFPDSEITTGNDVFSVKYDKSKYQYLILNYDKLNQPESAKRIDKLKKSKIDFIILDEVQSAKGVAGVTRKISRRTNLMNLLAIVRKKNSKSKFLALSATPIVNHLREGKALLEMLNLPYDVDVRTDSNLSAAIMMFEKLSSLSIRQKHGQQKIQVKETDVEVLNPKISGEMINDPLAIEMILTPARIPAIIKNIEGQTIIYTEYVGNSKKDASILKQLESALKKKKISCGFYTGNTSTQKRRSVLEAFLRKKITVLIASVPISVGVDGLQGVCSRLIFNSLPWTHAQYEQIVGRVARQGQTKPVTIFHINGKLTFSKNGKKRSLEYDKAIKHSRIKYKQTLSDCAVDGIIPKSKDLATPKQAAKEAVRWLKRLQSGKEPEITK
jgi:SNF2 family DNA or RNA helicase